MTDEIRFPESILTALDGRALSQDDIGRSGAFVAYAGSDYVIKVDKKGALSNAAKMQTFLSSHGFSPEVVYYESADRDYLISKRAAGENATGKQYISQPERLAAALGKIASSLHALPKDACPVSGMTGAWKKKIDQLSGNNHFDAEYTAFLGIESREEALEILEKHAHRLSDECVIHGDMCLPNFIFKDFEFQALIDVGDAGIGDRHFDLFWTLWSLWYNLKSAEWTGAFLAAYGRQNVDFDLIRACGAMCAIWP